MHSFSANQRYSQVNALNPCDCEARIEVFVVVAAFLVVVRYILDNFRRRSANQILQFLLITLQSLPYALLIYTIGLMQLSKSNNDIYQVWAVVLVTLQYSIKAVRPSGIYGKQNPLQDVMSSLWTANLLGTRTTLLKIPLWFLWSLNSIRIILGFADTELTSSRYQRQLRLLTEYMRTEHEYNLDCDPIEMKGYKYVVWGEDKQKIKSEPPEYRVKLEVTKQKKFITTDKVWERNGVLLGDPKESNELKDLCLAFSMFKLLRRRFFALPIHEANQAKTNQFIITGLFNNDNYSRAFKIIEAELSFFYDFFYTRYAVIFSRGFPFLRLVLSLSVIGVAFYLALIFSLSKDRLEDDLSKTINGVVVTSFLLFILTLKEIWEMVTYVLSDWTKVVLISDYVQKTWWTRCPAIVAVMNRLCKCKIAKRWHGTLWQYNLLQSFRCHPPLKRRLLMMLGCQCLLHRPGCKGSPPNTLPEGVKSTIGEMLRHLCKQPEALENYLAVAVNSLESLPLDFEQRISLTNKFATESQKILVWHMATCYCEIKLVETFQRFSSIKSPFLLENLAGLQPHYEAATALSQYSAYLVSRQSPLVPDRSFVARELFLSIKKAIQDSLDSCDKWGEVLQTLDELVNEEDNEMETLEKERKNKRVRKCSMFCFGKQCVIFRLRDNKKKRLGRCRHLKGKVILKLSVRLGRTLLDEIKTDIERWKFLEKFWAGYLLHLAASVSPKSHKESLSGGGQFLTHLWAFLCHAGVLGKTVQDDPLVMGEFTDITDDNY